MTEYKLINPSDPYTFLAKTKESAALAVFLLGTMYEMHYCLSCMDLLKTGGDMRLH